MEFLFVFSSSFLFMLHNEDGKSYAFRMKASKGSKISVVTKDECRSINPKNINEIVVSFSTDQIYQSSFELNSGEK